MTLRGNIKKTNLPMEAIGVRLLASSTSSRRAATVATAHHIRGWAPARVATVSRPAV